jgi:hypothetical protein
VVGIYEIFNLQRISVESKTYVSTAVSVRDMPAKAARMRLSEALGTLAVDMGARRGGDGGEGRQRETRLNGDLDMTSSVNLWRDQGHGHLTMALSETVKPYGERVTRIFTTMRETRTWAK